MKKKICMLTLAVALSATALVGCSSNKEAEQTTEYEGESQTAEDLEVIPENAADDAAAEDTENTDAANEADNADAAEDTNTTDEAEDADNAESTDAAEDANAEE